MPKVTVIIPAYNAEPYIKKCANSVLHQTLNDIEIIFIDDGSMDKTGLILDEIAKKHSNVKVVHQKNQGLYKSRETGLLMATGDYIGWVDADDYIEFNMFEVLYNTAVKYDSELVICDYSWFPRKIQTKEKWFREYKGERNTNFVERNSQPWNKIVKKELMERLNIGALFVTCYDEIYIRILLDAKNPVTVKQQLYHYRVSSNSMSSSYTNVEHYRKFVVASQELKKVMSSNIENTYWTDYFDYRIIYYLLMTMIVAANAGDKIAYNQNRRDLLSKEPKYYKNQHYWKILIKNYGVLKAVAIGKVIPINYLIARAICIIGMK